MKQIFLSMSLLLAIAVKTSFANNNTGPGTGVEEVFKQEFSGAENVSWSMEGDFQKATFVLAGHRVLAYFTQDNEMAGCIRDIFFDQLPIVVVKAVNKRFSGADVQEIREITNDDGTAYLMKAEFNHKKYKIRVSSSGNITDIEKLAK